MRFTTRSLVLTCSGLLMTGLGCNDGLGPDPKTGSVKVSVVTTAETIDRDKDGYTIRLGTADVRTLMTDGTVEYLNVPVGVNSVRLESVAANCSVAGAAEQSVHVIADGTTSVSFAVSCAANVGAVKVTTVTTGADADADGYVIRIDGAGSYALQANGTRSISGIRVGPVSVNLSGLAMNCKLEPPFPGTVGVIFGSIDLLYTIRCGASGTLRITTSSTGSDFDPDGFEVSIREQASGSNRTPRVPANGTYSLSPLLEGAYRIVPELRSNCRTANAPIEAIIAGGAQTDVQVNVVCDAVGRMAFVKGEGDAAEIYVATANGAGMTRITTRDGFDGDPAWSPDGRRIAFTSGRDFNSEIYLMDADGGNVVRLTTSHAADYGPAWSPDGSRIAFVSQRDGDAEIYVMNSDGSNPVNVTASVSFDSDPAWSPDGTRLAFRTSRNGGGIWIANTDGSQPAALTIATSDRHPAWSPDGKKIAFARDISANTRDIFIINVDGSLLMPLTSGLMEAGDPAWSPDGSRIVITATTRDCFGFYYYGYPCYDYLAVYLAGGGIQETLWSLSPAFDAAWAR